jgi:tripartite-type tricarboxylate transporter receptor subunit TctC
VLIRIFVLVLVLLPLSANAQSYPTKLVRIVVGSPGGGGIDITGRPIAQRMSEVFGQQVIVDNRPGAAGMLANDLVAKSAPDGHTILLTPGSFITVSTRLNVQTPFDPLEHFAPVIQISAYQFVLVAHPSVPAKNARELIAVAKARPNALTFVSSGVGSNFHLAGELFRLGAKIELWHVPYKGSPSAVVDLLAGRGDMMFTQLPPVMSYIKSGRLRAIGVTGARRSTLLPDVQTIAESALPGYELYGFEGVLVPLKTPRDIVLKLNSTITNILNTPEMKELWINKGLEFPAGTPEQFGAKIRLEYENAGKLIKAAGIKSE